MAKTIKVSVCRYNWWSGSELVKGMKIVRLGNAAQIPGDDGRAISVGDEMTIQRANQIADDPAYDLTVVPIPE